jgi:universal stress protein E
VIPKFAKDHDVDLVVMGTLGRLGQRGTFIGDTAERILNRLESLVLAVKPAGFISPVDLPANQTGGRTLAINR